MQKENKNSSEIKLLVIGSGARENCLAWKLSLHPYVNHIYVSPGNGGTHCMGEKITPILLTISKKNNFLEVCDFAANSNINLVVIGPENYLCDGITDALHSSGILCFGPTASAAMLEGSKTFSKLFMKRHRIPTAEYKSFKGTGQSGEAIKYAECTWAEKECVIKASGLAAGKGVIVPNSLNEAILAIKDNLLNGIHGEASSEIIIEEKLEGKEVSILVLCNGKDFISLPPSHDYKRLNDGDYGPNTGGMGAVCPTPRLDSLTYDKILTEIIKPTIDGLNNEGIPFIGCLYTGIILTHDGPKVLEYNVRFGDPETQAILPCISDDFYEIILACSQGLPIKHFTIKPSLNAISVVLASQGYPSSPVKGISLQGLNTLKTEENVHIFQAGTQKLDESLQVSGGRVLTVTSISYSFEDARKAAYALVDKICWTGCQYRTDIGN